MDPYPGLVEDFMAEALDSFLLSLPPHLPPKRTGFNRDSIDNLEVVERFIPTSTLFLFLDFALEGQLYSGDKTSLPLIVEDEVQLFAKSYADWAPAPWNRQSASLSERMLADRDDFYVNISRKISCMRARLWEGMVPMSGARWKEKRLDNPKNWQGAFEVILLVVRVFMWLGDPDVVRGIQNSFNYIAEELVCFQDALNAKRRQAGVGARVNLKSLWLEYITDLFETMVSRTYEWLHDRINELHARGKAEYEAVADVKGTVNANVEAKAFLAMWADLNKLHRYADFAIMMPLNYFAGFPAPNRTYSKVVGFISPLSSRQDQIREIDARFSWRQSEKVLQDPRALHRNRDDINALFQETKQNNEHMRLEYRGAPKKLGRQHWIAILHSRTQWSLARGGPRDQKWGFVVYMLTHRPSKEEWNTFRTKLYADFAKSGEWVEGFEEVKANMDLQWIDSREVGIPHDDVDAARRHFRSFSTTTHMRRRAWKQDFFVIDTASFASYMEPPTAFQDRPPYGDYGGFLTLIDMASYRPQVIHEQAPGYQNKLRVLGSLVFDDVYPLIASLAQRPRDLWPLAMRHPNQVYVGPPVAEQEKDWDVLWKLRGVGWRCFMKWRNELPRNAPTVS